ncbi:parallel beta-helix repeat-containing protein [Burkholderia multivorans]|uniref:right-handed parallel beta-helix repeat-containing protein n=1 Tax=Burkholderia multivorans TaxID=87883 RepID=UPI0009E0CBE5|nr:right-handed parallel beta-helix repeat-containing protein [Burkholderia multivorans]SAK19276.1 parallel beta-helix repeat-containing protein [Burkholderia multivorans]
MDQNGHPLAGGSVYFYIPNTSTKKNTYQDAAQTILNTNPIILDANGQAIIWGSGSYRQVVYDQYGNLIWDQITQDANANLTGNLTDATYVAGVDFDPGVTNVLTLPADPGTISNTWIFFDGTYQTDSQIASLSYPSLTFSSPIPEGVSIVTVKIGNTVAVGVPAARSVGDSQIVWGTILARNVDSIAALGALTPGVYKRVFVNGYYAPGDGGGGHYYYSASTAQGEANGGTIIAAAGGVGCWLLDHTGPVSVKQFGAKGDGVNDDAPPIQACITACTDTWIPDGTYLFNSTNVAPIPVTNPINVLIQSKNNFSIKCSAGAKFTCSNTANYSCMFGFWKCQNFVFDGPTLLGNRTGLSSDQESVGINLMSVVQFEIKNVYLKGNWGDSGTAFGGDWWVNGLIQNVQMDQIGQGFDVAFMQNVIFDNVNIFGYSIVTGGAGNIGFNTSYDVPLANYNFTGISFLGGNTNHLYFRNFRVQNMNAGALIATGSYLFFDEQCNFNNNQGTTTGSISGWGVILTYSTSYPSVSTGFPVNKVYFQGTKIENNGLLVNGGGVLIDGSNIMNGDVISDIVFDNCLVYNNGISGIVTTGEDHLSKIIVQNCQFESGGSQANPIVGRLINNMNSNSLPNNARITNNFGFNPYGFFTPTLPGGTGSGNTIYNTYSFPMTIYVFANPSAYNPNIVQPSGAGTINLGIVAAGSGPQSFTLAPGAGIFFNTNVPSAWSWYGN